MQEVAGLKADDLTYNLTFEKEIDAPFRSSMAPPTGMNNMNFFCG